MSESMIPKGAMGVVENQTVPMVLDLTSVSGIAPSHVVVQPVQQVGFKFDGNALVVILFITGLVLGAILMLALRNDPR